jgi:hypothetical protein
MQISYVKPEENDFKKMQISYVNKSILSSYDMVYIPCVSTIDITHLLYIDRPANEIADSYNASFTIFMVDISSGVYICKSIVNDLRHGNYICKSEVNYLDGGQRHSCS